MKTSLLFLYTETSLHAGTGSSVAAVDLPIQRERTTGFPIVQGSGIKGALRSLAPANDESTLVVFGPETGSAADHAGALSVGEARVVLFPVRSLVGVFAYVTCPQVLARLERDAVQAGLVNAGELSSLSVVGDNCLVTSNSAAAAGNAVVLEEFSFEASQNTALNEIAEWLASNALPIGDEYAYWRDKIKNSLVVLSDDAFSEFVRAGTEITTHVRLQPDTKTVASGALWTEEALPADTLLVSAITARRARRGDHGAEEVTQYLVDLINSAGRIQLGGNETTGQGIVGTRLVTV